MIIYNILIRTEQTLSSCQYRGKQYYFLSTHHSEITKKLAFSSEEKVLILR